MAPLQQAESLLKLLGAIDGEERHRDRPRDGPVAGRTEARKDVASRAEVGPTGGGGPGGGAVERARPFRPWRRCNRRRAELAGRAAGSDSDVCDRVAALEEFEASGWVDSVSGRIHRGTAQYVLHVREQLLRELRCSAGFSRNTKDYPPTIAEQRCPGAHSACPARPCVAALLTAFPDRLVRRSGPGSRFGRMVGGRGVRHGRFQRGTRRDAVSGRGRRSRRVRGPGPRWPRPSSASGFRRSGSSCGRRSSSTPRAAE